MYHQFWHEHNENNIKTRARIGTKARGGMEGVLGIKLFFLHFSKMVNVMFMDMI